MNHQRSRSRERPNTYRQEQNDQYPAGYNYPKSSSTDRNNQERSSSNPKQYNQNNLYPPYQGQFRKSPSPIKSLHKQSKPTSNTNPLQYQGVKQKLSFKDINLKKLQKLQQLQQFLKIVKKPFQHNDIPLFQSILQKFSSKYKFQQIYSTFVYFFIHYSLLDENIYRMFYGIIAKGVLQMDSLVEMGSNPLVSFYDILIKSTIKVAFDEFKKMFRQSKKINLESYFMISQQQRQNIVNKSLYPSFSGQIGSSIRNTLTLIRKSMQREKAPSERSPDFVHPIRQILKLLRTTIKSLLQKIFLAQQSPLSQQIESNNIFYLILFSELSMIIHSKYKHHLTAEYEETLNEITIMKMKLSQIRQEIQTKIHSKNTKSNSYSREDQQIMKALQFTYERLKKQHDTNYLYLLFVMNLSTFNRNSSVGQKVDSSIFNFFIEPLIDEYSKSSQFLAQKIEQNLNKVQKLKFFLMTVKNYGMYESIEKCKYDKNRQKLYNFVNLSYSNLILRSIDYITCQTIDNNNKQNIGEKFLCILNSLSYKKSSFNEINELKSIKSRISNIKKSNNLMQIEQQTSLKSTHVQDEFSFLIDDLIKVQIQNIQKKQKLLVERIKNDFQNIQSVKGKVNIKQNQLPLETLKITGQQQKIPHSQKDQQSLQKIIKLMQSLKQCFKNKQNYQKLLLFLFSLYKNNKFLQAHIFAKQYQSLNKQLNKAKRSEDLIDVQDEVIEKQNKEEKYMMKINEYVSKKVNKIKSINGYQKKVLNLLFQNLRQQTIKGQTCMTLQFLNSQLLRKLGNTADQLLIPQVKMSFLAFMLYQQEQEQNAIMSKQLQKFLQTGNNYKELRKNASSNFVKNKWQQIEHFSKIIKNYLQVKQLLQRKSTVLSSIQRIINEKKAELLQKDIDAKLHNIISQIITIYKQVLKDPSQSSLQAKMIDLQIVIENLLIKLFEIEKETKNYINPKQQVAKNVQNQKQSFLRNKLTSQINITLLDKKISYSNRSQFIYTPRQCILSHILTSVYKKFSSIQKIKSITQNLTNTTCSSLEDILVLKLKKCISLYFDKINDYMLNEFILSKKLFILRCIAITFYKMKQLADMVLNKFGVLGNGYGANLSPQMTRFVQDIFFFIPNKQALLSYLKFVTTKDRLFIKNQLKKYHSFTNGKVDKLIQMVDTM